MLELINKVLDLSKIEAKQMELQLRPSNVRNVLKEIEETYQTLAKKKGIRLLAVTSSEVSSFVIIDEDKLRQILVNLVGNAIKFTEKGTVQISVELKNKSLLFSVKDSGIGISEEKLEEIFEAFNQSDISITKTYGGTGLGLTILRSWLN